MYTGAWRYSSRPQEADVEIQVTPGVGVKKNMAETGIHPGLLDGSLDSVPEVESRIIRVFLSSTFSGKLTCGIYCVSLPCL